MERQNHNFFSEESSDQRLGIVGELFPDDEERLLRARSLLHLVATGQTDEAILDAFLDQTSVRNLLLTPHVALDNQPPLVALFTTLSQDTENKKIRVPQIVRQLMSNLSESQDVTANPGEVNVSGRESTEAVVFREKKLPRNPRVKSYRVPISNKNAVSGPKIQEILDRYPNLKSICLSSYLVGRIPRSVLYMLQQRGVTIEYEDRRKERKKQPLSQKQMQRRIDRERQNRREYYKVGSEFPPETLPEKRWGIWKQLKELHLSNPDCFSEINSEDLEVLKLFYQLSGMQKDIILRTLKDISTIYGVSEGAVNYWRERSLKKLGISDNVSQPPAEAER